MTPTDLAGLCERLRAYHNDCTPPRMDYALSDGLAFALTEAAAAIESLVDALKDGIEQADWFAGFSASTGSEKEVARIISAPLRTALEGASDDR
jgi:hypothetical protein